MQAHSSMHLCGVPENLNLNGLDLGSTLNPGPASDSSQQGNLEPESSVDWESTHAMNRGGWGGGRGAGGRGKPSVAETL